MYEINERITKLRKEMKLSQTAFAKRLGFSRDVISNIDYKRNEPRDYVLKAICREFNVDYIWLTTGKGDPISQLDDASMAQIDSIMTGENEFHKNLIKMIATLDDDAISRIEEQLRLLLDKQNKKADD